MSQENVATANTNENYIPIYKKIAKIAFWPTLITAVIGLCVAGKIISERNKIDDYKMLGALEYALDKNSDGKIQADEVEPFVKFVKDNYLSDNTSITPTGTVKLDISYKDRKESEGSVDIEAGIDIFQIKIKNGNKFTDIGVSPEAVQEFLKDKRKYGF